MKGGAVCYRGKEGREGGLGMLGVCNFRGSGREGLLEKGSREANLKEGVLHKALWEHPGVGLTPHQPWWAGSLGGCHMDFGPVAGPGLGISFKPKTGHKTKGL